MRRVLLPIGMLLMGIALVGGSLTTLLGTQLTAVDEQVGTHGSAAAAILGIGLIFAALNPAANLSWVRLGILYGFVVLVFEGGSALMFRKTFHLGPVIFGLAFSLLLIATYPERKKLIPSPKESEPEKEPAPTPPADSAPLTPERSNPGS
ncbi:MAG TPA: hypothetical protein VM674_02100 [Candidatus Acidoferrum sp.]|nr:hypothetical protein [Candidatus Acidoferrum sp.]